MCPLGRFLRAISSLNWRRKFPFSWRCVGAKICRWPFFSLSRSFCKCDFSLRAPCRFECYELSKLRERKKERKQFLQVVGSNRPPPPPPHKANNTCASCRCGCCRRRRCRFRAGFQVSCANSRKFYWFFLLLLILLQRIKKLPVSFFSHLLASPEEKRAETFKVRLGQQLVANHQLATPLCFPLAPGNDSERQSRCCRQAATTMNQAHKQC